MVRIKTEHIIIVAIDAVVIYLFYTGTLNQYVLLGVIGISIYFLTKVQNVADNITLRQAKDLTMNEVREAQQKNEIPPGTPEVYDAGVQEYVFENAFKPWKYLIGVIINGDIPFYYLSTVSLSGSHMRLSPKEAGWNFDDEFKIIEVKSPEVENKELPPSNRKTVRIG